MLLPVIAAGFWHRVRVCAPVLSQFIDDQSGQDFVEYALLAGFIGIAGWAVLSNIDNSVANTYQSWLSPSTGVNSLWAPPEPLTSGS